MSTSDNETSVFDQLVGIIKNISKDNQLKLLELLKQWDENGERSHSRKPCLITVDYSSQDRFFRDFIQDISAGGIFIETRELFNEGLDIGLTFSIPNSQIPFRISGEIVRTTSRGVAVKFKNVTTYQQEILRSLVK
ncbi:MAG: PilZ domain-containing protein, partial [Deltaproteobacteria bacterium]|nr:PilZ domain-containing protein [Deltaproteobacteria bacterium]